MRSCWERVCHSPFTVLVDVVVLDCLSGLAGRSREVKFIVSHLCVIFGRKRLQAIGLNPEYVGADVRGIETECAVLEGKDVYVMSGQDYSVSCVVVAVVAVDASLVLL